jgi:CRISPR/Cas system-associated exonuclease Cas4 (RecB family)
MGEIYKFSWATDLDKFPYKKYLRASVEGERLYSVENISIPSVTTILSATKDMKGLQAWINRVGKEKAEEIKKKASDRGSEMHEFIERRLLGHEVILDSPDSSEAARMAKTVLTNMTGLNIVYGSEVSLSYKNLWAGTADLTCLYENQLTIGDFKQANKMKEEKWIDDYFCQLVAYAMAHTENYGEVEQGKIFMVTPELKYKEFELNKFNYEKYKKIWLNKVEQYYKNRPVIKPETITKATP